MYLIISLLVIVGLIIVFEIMIKLGWIKKKKNGSDELHQYSYIKRMKNRKK